MKPLNIRTAPYADDENAHVKMTNVRFTAEFGENYRFVRTGGLFRFLSVCLYTLVFFVLWPFVFKFYYGIRVKGKKNIKKCKRGKSGKNGGGKGGESGGTVICMNHVTVLDPPNIAVALFPRIIPYHAAAPFGFNIPVVSALVKGLRAVPVPPSPRALHKMYTQTVEMLKRGGSLVIAPEASAWPYYARLRNFKKGAFTIAAKARANILPAVFCYRRARGLRFWKSRPCLDLYFLEPISPIDENGELKPAERLMEETRKAMSDIFYERLEKERALSDCKIA